MSKANIVKVQLLNSFSLEDFANNIKQGMPVRVSSKFDFIINQNKSSTNTFFIVNNFEEADSYYYFGGIYNNRYRINRFTKTGGYEKAIAYGNWEDRESLDYEIMQSLGNMLNTPDLFNMIFNSFDSNSVNKNELVKILTNYNRLLQIITAEVQK